MMVHEQFAEDLALYALGALEGEERVSLEQHLDSCAPCRRELEELRGDTSLLALTTMGPKPPQRAKQRLMAAIAATKKEDAPATRRLGWFGGLAWIAAAAMALAVLTLWRSNADLQQRVAQLQNESQKSAAEMARVREEFQALVNAQQVTLTPVAAKTPPPPSGKAIYQRESGRLLFTASNLPSLPEGKAYELWLLPNEGKPVPAGVFRPDAKGSAVVVNPPLPSGVLAKGFAITVEPAAGSEAPTTQPMMVGMGL